MSIERTVLVLGGGIGGVEAAISLRKQGFRVLLVSNRDYYYLYPLSIWIPTGEAEFEQVRTPLDNIARLYGFTVLIDTVESIQAAHRQVVLREKGTLTYDYLVVALGAGKMQHPGQEHTLSICGDPQASLQLRQRLDQLQARGRGRIAMGFGGNPKDPSAVRGGPAFELLFNVHHWLAKRGLRENFELTLFAPMENAGARMGQRASRNLGKMLQKLNIKTQFGKKIEAFDPDGVLFADGSQLPSDLTMFIPAGTGHPALQNSDLPLNEAGFVKINDYGQSEGFPNVYTIGDAAAIEGPAWRAKQGHLADVMAKNAAFNIAATERGWQDRKGYRKHLSVLCVMDTGTGAVFVYRSEKGEVSVPLPWIGHQMKKAWGIYYSLPKRMRLPRLFPGREPLRPTEG